MVRRSKAEGLFPNDPFGIVMKTPVRWKKNKTKPIVVRETISRVVRPRPAPEVMVKVKRGGKSVGHMIAHLDYITRNGKLDAETERGEIVRGKAHVREIVKEWTSDTESVRPGARNTLNVILSMPPGTDPEGVKSAVCEFARQELSRHQYMFVLHTDDDHPHVHLSVRTLSFDGKKLDPRKDDLQVWREVFAQKLREQGIDAKATYRPSRGIVAKPLSMAHYKAKNWEQERARETERRAAEAESGSAAAGRSGIREIPQAAFRLLMNEKVRRYEEFLGMLQDFGAVEVRDHGRLSEHISVRPKGAQRSALLKDFVFTKEFIELDQSQKRRALAARLQQTKGLDYGEFIATRVAGGDRVNTFARVRDNLRAAEDHIRTARKAVGGIEQAGGYVAHRRVIEAVETIIRGRRDYQGTVGDARGGGVRDDRDGTEDARARSLGRIARNLSAAGDNLDAVRRTHRTYDQAAGRGVDRAVVRALSAIIQGYGRDSRDGEEEGRAGRSDPTVSAYLDSVIAPQSRQPARPRSERDLYTYVARVQDAISTVTGTPVEWRSGRHKKRDPWAEQDRVRSAWRAIARQLRDTGNVEDVKLAADVDSFVSKLPEVQTQQQQIAERIIALRRQQKAEQAKKPAYTKPPTIATTKGTAPEPDIARQDEPGRER